MKNGTLSTLEMWLDGELKREGMTYERHYRFHPTRKWEFDFAWPLLMLAVEIEGGTWAWGRHNQPEGYEKDCEKYNAATLLGWDVYRFTGKMCFDGDAMKTIKEALEG
jgi:hypothetical protein